MSMKKLLVAVMLAGSISVAHAQMPEPTPAEPAAPLVEEPAIEPPAQAGDGEAVAIRPPSSYAPMQPTRSVAGSETAREPDETPPLSGGRLFGELALGSLFSAGGIVGGAYIGYGIETRNGCNGEWCGLGGLVLGGVAGLTFVTPIGVYLVGSSNGQTGSLGATISGSVVGTLLGLAALGVSEGSEAGAVLLLAGPVVGSMIGFNVTRKYDKGHKARNWAPVASASNGNTSLGVVGRF